jgi:RNA polymerase sigma-70 factor, ECF subfamily
MADASTSPVSTAIPFPAGTASLVDERSLVDRARDGDREALNSLIGRYLGDVYQLTFRILGDSDMAEDASQDAFVNAMGGIRRFRGDASFRTWLLRIALNSARSIGRRQVRRRESPVELVPDLVSPTMDPASQAVTRSEGDRAVEALARLPNKQRLAVTLRTYQGLSYREIGDVLDCSEGAARVNYHLGIKRLRELLG